MHTKIPFRSNSESHPVPVLDIPQPLLVSHQSSEPYEVFQDLKSELFYIDTTSYSHLSRKRQVISLFSGAGGLDLGLEYAGFETAVCVEIDSDCRATLRHNRPMWKLFEDNGGRLPGDITSITANELLEIANLNSEDVDLIVGGVPCQPFSNIGKKKGLSDPQNGQLFMDFVRIVNDIKPRAFLFENVAGIIQKRHYDVIDYIESNLGQIGYGISYSILNAAHYGVGQRRERFFLLGILGIEQPSFPLPTHAKSLSDWISFTDGLTPYPQVKPSQWITLEDVLKQIPKNIIERDDYAVMNISPPVIERMKLINPGENFKVLPLEMRPNCWKNGKHQGHDTFGRLRLDEPSVTIRTAAYNPAKGKYIHPTENRGLNTIEMALIQSFPLSWRFKCAGRKKVTLVSAGRQIGNAVPPLLAEAVGKAINIQLSSFS